MCFLKLLFIFLIILYLFLLIKIYQKNKKSNLQPKPEIITENFFNSNSNSNSTLLDFISYVSQDKPVPYTKTILKDQETVKQSDPKTETRFIYLEKIDTNANGIKKTKVTYIFYNKSYNKYMTLYGTNLKDIVVKDIDNNYVGKYVKEKYNKYNFELVFYKDNIINVQFLDNYKSVRLFLEDDDKVFTIKNNNIYLFTKKIGQINEDGSKYKIIVYQEYKEYLNLFALGFINKDLEASF
jgi:hypothetical protein